jgi:hypothetical protein
MFSGLICFKVLSRCPNSIFPKYRTKEKHQIKEREVTAKVKTRG